VLHPLGPGNDLLGPEDETDSGEFHENSLSPGKAMDEDRKDARSQTKKEEGV
jgi:hypothetical protein